MNCVCSKCGVLMAAVAGIALWSTAVQAAVSDSFDSYGEGQSLQVASPNWAAVDQWSDAWTVSSAAALGAGNGIQANVGGSWRFTQNVGSQETWGVGQTLTVESDIKFSISDPTTYQPQVVYLGLFQNDSQSNLNVPGHALVGLDFIYKDWGRAFLGQYELTAYDTKTGIGASSGGLASGLPGLSNGAGTTDWMHLKAQFTKVADGTADLYVTLDDLGADGTAAAQNINRWTKTGFAIDSDVFNATKVAGGYDIENASGLTSLMADNYAMTVPEPATLGLLGVVVGGMLIRRRRVA